MSVNESGKKGLQLFLFVFTIILLLGSCKSTQVVVSEPKQLPKDTLTSRKQVKVDSVFLKMKSNEINFDWMQSKFSVDYENGDDKKSFGGQIRIKRDSAIWVSISLINMEFYRVMITQDSIKMLDKFHNTYFAAKIDYINKLLNTDLDYDMLQALLTGSDFPYYENNVFEVLTLGNDIFLSTISRRKLKKIVATNEEYEKILVQNMRIDKASYKILKQSVKQVRDPNKKIEIEYSNFLSFANQLFPMILEIKMEDSKTIKVKIEYSKTIFDEVQSFPMKVPDGYTRNVVPE